MNQSWSIDFMHDALVCGRRFRTFNVGMDDYNREALAIEIDLNILAQRVVRVLTRIVANRGIQKMRMDNGPELVSTLAANWAEEHGVMLEVLSLSARGRCKPTQNRIAFIERFNRTTILISSPHIPIGQNRNTGFYLFREH